MNTVFRGTVQDGKIQLWARDRFRQAVLALDGSRIELVIRKQRDKRSLDQNAYFHGVVVPMISDYTGHEHEEIKEHLKFMFLKVEKDGFEYVRPTSSLNTKEMAEFTDRCMRWAATELGVVIPAPGMVE